MKANLIQIIQQMIIVHNNWRIYKIRLVGEVINDRHLKETIKRKRNHEGLYKFLDTTVYLFVAG